MYNPHFVIKAPVVKFVPELKFFLIKRVFVIYIEVYTLNLM